MFERFIAQKLLPKGRDSFSRPLVNIATISISLGIIVMIMSVCILRGFQQEFEQKISGFGSHITVSHYNLSQDHNDTPISITHPSVEQIRNIEGVTHVQPTATKGGMIKTEDQIHGIIYKGVDTTYDTTFFYENLTCGRLFRLNDSSVSNEVIISSTISQKLDIDTGDKIRTYFWQGSNYRARAFNVVGIYNTDLTEFDDHFIVGDLGQIQRINNWTKHQAANWEILINNFDRINAIADKVVYSLPYEYNTTTIIEQNMGLFSWLNLLNSNITLILIIMAMVCSIAIISALLIMIFEKTSTIGILKTLGANNKSISKIFLIKSTQIITKGIVWGDLIALVLCIIQKQFHIVKLDSASYSMDFVPIDLNPNTFIIISIGALIICLLALLIPVSYISKIRPAESIKIEQ